MGEPSRFCARVITTSGVPSACTKSCAVWPMRRSGGVRPTRRAHRPVEEGVGLRARRPDALVEPAEHDPVVREQARFEKAQDLDAAMRRARRRAERSLLGERREEGGVIDEAARAPASSAGCRKRQVVEERGERFAEASSSALASASSPRRPALRRAPCAASRRGRLVFAVGGRREAVEGGLEALEQRVGEVPVPRSGVAAARGVRRSSRRGASPAPRAALEARARRRAAQHADLEHARRARRVARQPRRTSGWASSASTRIGWKSSAAASAASRARRPAGVSDRATPAESSTARPQRASSAATRAASARSGVTRAAVRPGMGERFAQGDRDGERLLALVHRPRRWRGLAVRSARALGSGGDRGPAGRWCRPGAALPRDDRARRRFRLRWPAPRIPTSARGCADACRGAAGAWPAGGRAPDRSGASRRAADRRQLSSSRSVSRPGSTTAPFGRRAMAAMRVAVAGIEPVEPAAMTGVGTLAGEALALPRRSGRCAAAPGRSPGARRGSGASSRSRSARSGG